MSVRTTPTADSASDLSDRRLYLAGTVGPIVFWLVVLILGFITPGYNRIRDAISDLGAVGAPYAVIQQANFLLLGLAVLAFVVALDRQFREGRWPWIGVVLVGMFGLFGAIGSAIPVNPAAGAQLSDQLHAVAGIVGFHSALVGIPLTSRRLAKHDGWSAYDGRAAVLGITALIVGAYAVFVALGIGMEGYMGLAQILYAGTITAWVAGHAYHLYRQ